MPRGQTAPAYRTGLAEFIALIASMMALTALSIDMMLPALPAIGESLGLHNPNNQQFVVFAYMAGFALGQPFYGPLSDSLGRKPVLFVGLGVFVVASLLAAVAPSFETLLAARALQGFGAAAARIIAVAIVRDRFAGREMAQVMSFVMMVFIIVPVLAPSIGALALFAGPWRWIFVVLACAGGGIFLWSAARLIETRPERAPLSLRHVLYGFRRVITNRIALGYTIASGFLFGCLFSYIGASEQIIAQVYGLERLFPLIFGATATMIAAASIVNARLVRRYGMRRLSRWALGGLVALCGVVLALGLPEHPPLFVFIGFMCGVLFCFGLIGPNFNALAMEPLGDVAGAASSVIGFYSTAAAALFGAVVAQAFDGTLRPIFLGDTILVVLTVVTVLIFDREPAGPETAPAE